MKNKRVVFGSSIEYYDPSTGLKEWDRPTIEFDIDDNEDFLENLNFAKMIVKEFYKGQPKYVPSSSPETKVDKIDSFIATINYCTSKKFLDNFKKRVDEENVPKLTEAYYKKLKEFQ